MFSRPDKQVANKRIEWQAPCNYMCLPKEPLSAATSERRVEKSTNMSSTVDPKMMEQRLWSGVHKTIASKHPTIMNLQQLYENVELRG